MPESVAALDCPTVPSCGNGTAGQPASRTNKSGTARGTSAGTARLKALEKLALLRDRQQDRGWDNATDDTSALSHRPESRRDSGGTVSAPVPCRVPPGQPAERALGLGALPAGPCSDCGGGLWWCVSVLSAGPGPGRLPRSCQAGRCGGGGAGRWSGGGAPSSVNPGRHARGAGRGGDVAPARLPCYGESDGGSEIPASRRVSESLRLRVGLLHGKAMPVLCQFSYDVLVGAQSRPEESLVVEILWSAERVPESSRFRAGIPGRYPVRRTPACRQGYDPNEQPS